MTAISVTPTLAIDDGELDVSFARASGPGGQNVNKVESAVHLRFDVFGSPSLDDGTKRRLAALAGRRRSDAGVRGILAPRPRSPERNREDAIGRLLTLIAAAAERPKFRVKTRPTLAAKRRRVDAKVQRGETKRGRGRVYEP